MQYQIIELRNPFYNFYFDFYCDICTYSVYEHIFMHIHEENCVEIAYVSKGKGFHFFGEEKTAVSRGDIIIIPPLTPHTFRPIDKENSAGLEVFNCLFNLDFIESFDQVFLSDARETLLESNFAEDYKIPAQNANEIYEKGMEMLREYSAKQIGHVPILRFLLCEYIQRIYRTYLTNQNPKAEKQNQIVVKAVEFINQNFKQSISIEDICQHCFISRSYLCKLFKNSMQMSIMQYVKQVRISAACTELSQTNKKITDICRETGFNDYVFFSHVFKRITGVSPRDYRKNFTANSI